ncbi:hypothetical protein DDZ18_07940 [Marinicauda salina]|uniref:Thioesterase domain-containing protein n=1 Tax=Marinicauda salina TaxID=2135793 RepID=A0A2U2BUA6_9PROT|nr:PaaI family thioesterase [Marinicauda salina]PWE17588.1 hypothetical protein DDZ18_07940 [Marinicauda salina]
MSRTPLDKETVRRLLTDPENIPEATRLFGFELIDIDPEAGWAEAAFHARREFLNPNGSVQGGIVTGFLDEAMSVAAFVMANMEARVPTLEMKTSFLRPLGEGRCTARGEVVRLGRSVAFTQGRLFDAEGALCATATATAAVRRR